MTYFVKMTPPPLQASAAPAAPANEERIVRVFDPMGIQYSSTSWQRAEELVLAKRAYWAPGSGEEEIVTLHLTYVPFMVVTQIDSDQNQVRETKSARSRRHNISTLRKRDGDLCFYCLKEMAREEMTREHLLASHAGGSDRNENLVLAHARCNEAVGHLSIAEKVRARERNFARILLTAGPDITQRLLQQLKIMPVDS
ncbi:HNH endonuclease [Pseudomonas oryzihabitans]|uniref:HNH endonuclease n=1 Tax=Pseudomonas oryzihabitans TaxID=47885 RepID=A0A1G5PDH7_9PSED|nr:HNH endonuclease [Pseudomonas psychrotolerans]NMY91744.1 HNH endonuclease [Pseudomonas psychrotolerans]NMY92043.1 HNH endonuclease [Pseudomonas psychrotolerans]SCZ47605.1 HNH endonuclease [Pseudomonas psychrotolerans]